MRGGVIDNEDLGEAESKRIEIWLNEYVDICKEGKGKGNLHSWKAGWDIKEERREKRGHLADSDMIGDCLIAEDMMDE